MQTISISDPEWQETFPHWVAPLPDEWLFGLLLRCDEVNAWGSGTTQTHWLRLTRGQSGVAMSNFVVGTFFHMGTLARLLGLSERSLLATTYYLELARLYTPVQPQGRQLIPDLKLRCCPECVAQKRLIRRTCMLPQIRSCLVHKVKLLSQCPCGRGRLRARTMLEEPFVCDYCNTRWEDFPRIVAKEEDLLLEQRSLICYDFFLSGNPCTSRVCPIPDRPKDERE